MTQKQSGIVNKKIKNAQAHTYKGIKFRSALEVTVYKELQSLGITPMYEKKKFILSPKVSCKVPFYVRMKKGFIKNTRAALDITYTPDFTFKYGKLNVIMEVKGFENDTYPMKRNLFRKLLETYKEPVIFFEVRSKEEVVKSILILKEYEKSL